MKLSRSTSIFAPAGRGIESIEYDNFGNPVYFDLKGRDYTKNVYSATGVKLKTTHYTEPVAVKPPISMETPLSAAEPESTAAAVGPFEPGTQLMAGMEELEYHGPVIYRNGKIDMVLFPGGYATVATDKSVTFYYYTQDYLGNNRAVVNGSTGAIEQTTAYYPYGAVIPDLGTGNSNQPFKYGSKELVSANGLNMYDFGARLHYPAIPQFDRVDPLCEKFTWLSPYLYCGNDPVNGIDKDGKEWKFVQAPLKSFVWVDKAEARDASGNLRPNHYEQAIIFTANGEDGTRFNPSEDYNIGSSTAVVCKADGSTEKFKACTNPSNSEKYATVPEGNYEAKVGTHKQSYTALRVSDVGTENFNANSIELGVPNPSNTNTTKARGINIHKPGFNNLTGETKAKLPISMGCLLIDRDRWNSFIGIFNSSDQKNNIIGILLQR